MKKKFVAYLLCGVMTLLNVNPVFAEDTVYIEEGVSEAVDAGSDAENMDSEEANSQNNEIEAEDQETVTDADEAETELADNISTDEIVQETAFPCNADPGYSTAEAPFGTAQVTDDGTLGHGEIWFGDSSSVDEWYSFRLQEVDSEYAVLTIDSASTEGTEAEFWTYDPSEEKYTFVCQLQGDSGEYSFDWDTSLVYYVKVTGKAEVCSVRRWISYRTGKLDSKSTQIASGETIHLESDDINDAVWYKIHIPDDSVKEGVKKWIKITVPENASFPLTMIYYPKSETGICYFISSHDDDTEKESTRWYSIAPVESGDVYVRLSGNYQPWAGEVTIKIVDVTETEVEGECVPADQISVKSYASALASITLDYLNELYLAEGSQLGRRISYVTDAEEAELKKLAEHITAGCTTDGQKADAIAKWVDSNITYKSGASSYSMTTWYTREGNCDSYSHLMQDLMRLCGIIAVTGSGYEGDFENTSMTYADLGEIGHGWTFAYIDGEWKIYDPLFDHIGYTWSDGWAKHYLNTFVDGVVMSGEGAPITGALDNTSSPNTISVTYEDGQFRLYIGSLPMTETGTVYTDSDGATLKYEWDSIGNFAYRINNLYYPFEIYSSDYNGMSYTDGFAGNEISNTKTKLGCAYRDGFINYGNWMPMYAYENSVLLTQDVEMFNGQNYFFDGGEPFLIGVDSYALEEGDFTVKVGTTGQILLPYCFVDAMTDPSNIISFSSSDPSIASVDETTGVVTTKKAGQVVIACNWQRTGSDGYAYIGGYVLNIVDDFRTYSVLDKPVLKSVSNESSGIKITWDAVSGAAGYQIYRNDILIKKIEDGTALNYTDTSAVSGNTYTYKITAYDDSVESKPSNEITVTRIAAASLSSCSNESSGIRITWGTVSGATGYQIYRSTDGTNYTKIKTLTSTSYTDTKASSNGQKYWYKVRAYCTKDGTTAVGSYSSVKSLYRSAPAALSSVKNSSSGIAVTWEKVSGASGYFVYRSAGTGSYQRIATIKSGSTVTYTDTAPAVAGKSYSYKIQAYVKAADGNVYKSTYSSEKKTYLLARPVISAVSKVSSGVQVKWGKAAKASGYLVYRSVNGGSYKQIKKLTSGSTVKYTDTTATKKGNRYSYKIYAYITVGGTSYLSCVSTAKSVTK